MDLLVKLAEAAKLREKIDAMFGGEHINATEDRAVLHVATRAMRDETIMVDGKNVVPDVWEVLDKIKDFTEKVRSGEWRGVTGKPIKNVVAIGIGGSFLGPLFVHTALRTDQEAASLAQGRSLRFLANVDPIDVARALNGLDAAETLFVVISKTFTTAETMLNARTVRAWLVAELGTEEAVSKHMVAVSTNLKLVKEFGIDPENAFGFWDWVGGRYSVCSAVGMLPLSLQYGFETMLEFLKGANDVDRHFREAPFEKNMPVLLGLMSIWNVSFLGHPARAILPYCQALGKLPAHIQQVSMESNGKGVDIAGNPLPFDSGEIDFGEPGTNGQHSFYQLIHQGRVIPCDFIGIIKSQQSVYLKNEVVSNHDELMCNFFAQADALAFGKTPIELRAEGIPESLVPHKSFTGNRPSLSLVRICHAPCRQHTCLPLLDSCCHYSLATLSSRRSPCPSIARCTRTSCFAPRRVYAALVPCLETRENRETCFSIHVDRLAAQRTSRDPAFAAASGADRLHDRAAAGAVRAPRCHPRLCLGGQLLRPVGSGARQGARVFGSLQHQPVPHRE